VVLAEWDVSAGWRRRRGMVGPSVGVGARPETVRPPLSSPGGRLSPLKLMGPKLSGLVLRNPPIPGGPALVKELIPPPWPVPTPVGVPPPSMLGAGRTGVGTAGAAAAGAGGAATGRLKGLGGRGAAGRGRPSDAAGPVPIKSWGDGLRSGLPGGASPGSLSAAAMRTASARVA
jgi:hypothetical protein